jgi:Transposase DDE domain
VREHRVPIQPSRRRGLDANAGLVLHHRLGQPLRAYRRHAYWTDYGWLAGGLKVLVVSYGAKDYATTRLTLPAAEVRRVYRGRAQIEEVIRVCNDQLGLTGCQARSARV